MESVSTTDIAAFEKLTTDFCKKSLSKFIDEHYPDSNFSLLPSLIDEACAIGIIPKATPNSTGYEYGIWGKQSFDFPIGITNSLTMLYTLAHTCASFAFLSHIQGLAAHILIRNNIVNDSSYPFLQFYDGMFPLYYTSPNKLAESYNQYNDTTDICTLETFGFGYNPQYALTCISKNNESIFLYFDSLDSVLLAPVRTHGLRGLVYNARFNTKVTHLCPIDKTTMNLLLANFWLGISAVALGIAESAYTKALEYANQRYQRGNVIKNIESVQMLLGTAHANITTAKNTLFSFNISDSSSLLHHAAISKLTVTTLCSQAVTHCLQVFGGYGYMEDFGIEKKFRDCISLMTIGGSPFFMKQFIAQMEMEG